LKAIYLNLSTLSYCVLIVGQNLIRKPLTFDSQGFLIFISGAHRNFFELFSNGFANFDHA